MGVDQIASHKVRVMAALAQGPCHVADIAIGTGIGASLVRRALLALEAAGLASRERSHGPWSAVAPTPPVAPADEPEQRQIAMDRPWWSKPRKDRSWFQRHQEGR